MNERINVTTSDATTKTCKIIQRWLSCQYNCRAQGQLQRHVKSYKDCCHVSMIVQYKGGSTFKSSFPQ